MCLLTVRAPQNFERIHMDVVPPTGGLRVPSGFEQFGRGLLIFGKSPVCFSACRLFGLINLFKLLTDSFKFTIQTAYQSFRIPFSHSDLAPATSLVAAVAATATTIRYSCWICA